MERKLAAIFAADIAGYSRLMGVDEEGTLGALRSHREVVDGLVGVHRGRVFNSAGDSVVAEFPSAVEATLCAVEIQQEIARRNEPVAKDKRLEFRIGLNIGDVMAEGSNLFGDGVNVADRVQKLAEPGGICVAGNVHDQLRNKVSFTLEPMGEHQVKNIAAPVSVYRVLTNGAVARPRAVRWLRGLRRNRVIAAAMTVVFLVIGGVVGWHLYQQGRPPPMPVSPDAALGLPVVLVLPFENLTSDPAQEVVGKGIAEDLRNLLWNFPDVQVVSSTSSDTSQVPKSAAQFVIEGTVRKSGQTAVITAQLIDNSTGAELRSDRFEGSIADPVGFEDTIAKALADKFGGMTGDMRKAYERVAWSKADADLTQYDYYVRGHMHHHRFTKEEVAIARDIWKEGLRRFPDSALLRIKISMTYDFDLFHSVSKDPAADMSRMRELVTEATALITGRRVSRFEEWYLHWASIAFFWSKSDFGQCIAEAKAAIEFSPYEAPEK
jgi:adenylate cyclase